MAEGITHHPSPIACSSSRKQAAISLQESKAAQPPNENPAEAGCVVRSNVSAS